MNYTHYIATARDTEPICGDVLPYTQATRLTTLRNKVNCPRCDRVLQGLPPVPPPSPLPICRYCDEELPTRRRKVCDQCRKERQRALQAAWRKRPANILTVRYSQIRRRAKKKGLPFTLTKQDAAPFVGAPCHYCGDPQKGLHLDRVDNARGYEPDNVVPCCPRCNYWKWAHTVESFLEHAKRIAGHQLNAPARSKGALIAPFNGRPPAY